MFNFRNKESRFRRLMSVSMTFPYSPGGSLVHTYLHMNDIAIVLNMKSHIVA